MHGRSGFLQAVFGGQQRNGFVRQIGGVFNFNAGSRFFQELFGVGKVLHGGPVEDHLSPGRGLQRILSSQRNQAAAAKNQGGQGINVKEFTEGVQDQNRLRGNGFFPRRQFRSPHRLEAVSPDEVGYFSGAVRMPGGQ